MEMETTALIGIGGCRGNFSQAVGVQCRPLRVVTVLEVIRPMMPKDNASLTQFDLSSYMRKQ